MKAVKKTDFCIASVSAIAIAMCSWGTLAQAQVTSPDQPEATSGATAVDRGFDEIVVTANKRSQAESAQKVATAISALDGKALERQHITTLSQLGNKVPSVQLSEGGGFKGSANFAMRGHGVISTIPTVEGTVGVFIDGIYLPSVIGVTMDLFDLDGVEVLRGPQGTLFGKNVTSGAVLLRTRDPSREAGVDIRASLLTGPEYKLQASVTGALTSTLAARLSVSYDKDVGRYRDALTNIRRGKSKTFIVRPSLMWEPTDSVRSVLKYEHGSIHGDAIPTQAVPYYPLGSFGFSNDYVGLTDLTWDQVTSTTTIDVGLGENGAITNVAGYRAVRDLSGKDIDASHLPIFNVLFFLDSKTFSEELRYSGTIFNIVDLVAGLYYFHSDINYIEERYLAALGMSPRAFGGRQTANTYAAFAQADVHLGDKLTVTLGGRYGLDEKAVDIASFSGAATRCSLVTETCNYNLGPFSDSWTSFTPKVGLRYELGDYQMVYASWTKAYRAGGYNIRITNLSQQPRFDQESNSTFEIGAKLDLFDRRLRINAAGYISKIKNMIRDVNTSVTQGGSTVGTVQDTRNTAEVTIKGIELDARLRVVEGLEIGGFLAYTHSKYDSILLSLIDVPGETIPVVNQFDYALQLPRLFPWQYGVNFTYDTEVGRDASLTVGMSFSHRDAGFASDNNLSPLPAYNNLDGNIRLGFDNNKYSVSLFGRNLLDEVDYAITGQLPASLAPGPNGTGTLSTYLPAGNGRTFGIEFAAQF